LWLLQPFGVISGGALPCRFCVTMQQWLLFSTRTRVETGRSCISCVASLSSQQSSSSSSLPAISLESRTQLQMHCQETSLTSSVLFTLRPIMPPLQSQQPSWIFSCCPNQTGHPGVGQSCGTVLSTGLSPFNPEDVWLSPEAVSSFLFTASFPTHSFLRTFIMPFCHPLGSVWPAGIHY